MARSSFKPEELSFIAEEEHVHIIPNFTEPVPLATLTGDFGPFLAGNSVSVPLWIALRLKEDQKCSIVPPEWMDLAKLKSHRAKEKSNQNEFMDIPFYYIEISRLLLSGW
jgi:GINS complex subunit 2